MILYNYNRDISMTCIWVVALRKQVNGGSTVHNKHGQFVYQVQMYTKYKFRPGLNGMNQILPSDI